MQMEKIMVTVLMEDFMDGVIARADLDSIRALVTSGAGSCSKDIKAVLGIPLMSLPVRIIHMTIRSTGKAYEDRENQL